MTYSITADSWPRWPIPAPKFGYVCRRLSTEAFLQDLRLQDLSPSPELAELLAQCALGDRAAFRRLYELQSARLFGAALRITRQSALAADAVHDALLQVWQNAARFDPERGNGEAWLLSLVRYRALDIARRGMRETPVTDDMPEPVDEEPDPLARLQSVAEASELHRCLEELEPERRRLVSLAFVEGLTHSELALRTRMPLGTVKSWIRRALAGLKRCLES